MAALPSSSSSSSSLAEDWAVLVTSLGVVTDEVTEDIRWHFEDPRIGGKLKRNGIVFLDDHRFVLHFRDSASSEKILSKGKHQVSINDEDIEMTVESYPVNTATEDIKKKSAVMMETEDDWISVPTNRFDDDLTRSSTEGINIVPDECHLDTEQPFDDHGPRSMLDGLGTSSDSDVGQRTIQVLDVLENMMDLVLLYLESAKHGGADVTTYSYDEDNRIFNATFLERDVAKHFVSKGSISIDGHEMKLRALPDEVESDNRTKEEMMETEENTDSVPKNMIEVKDLTPKLTQEMLKLYFENRKRSGGGTIKDIQLFPDEERAIITFQDAEAAERVIEKSEHLVLGVPVKCVPLDAAAINSPSCAIEVRGFDEKASEEMLTLFFENRRRSGGGHMEDLYYNADERRAVITFESPEVVERVLQNHRCTPLSLNEVRLTISALKPASFPLCSADDIELDKILTHNIPSDSSKDDLVRYMQRGAAASVTKIRYSLLPGTAMVYFQNFYDYVRLRDLVSSRPFRGVMLSIEKVPASHSIQVFNIDGISLDLIVLYFESSRSGGDEIKEGEINTSEGFAILTFAKREALASVLSKKHKLEGKILSVSEYYKGLGVMPPNVDSESPAWWLPPQLSLTCESQKLNFIMSSSKLKAKIEKEMESLYCKVEWPAAVGSADPRAPCAVVLHCALNHSTKNVGQLAKTWTDDCTAKMNREFSNILFEEINVLQELWKNVSDRRKSLEENIRDKENVQIIVDDSSCTIRVLGVQKSCKNFAKSLKELVLQAQQELEKEKRKISEQIQKLKGHQFEILKSIGFLDSNNDDAVDVTIKGQDVNFFGQPNDILAKKLKMYEILNAICCESLDLPSFVLDALKLEPFRNHISSCLQEKKVVSAWNLGPKGLFVYGLSQSEIDKTASILKSEVIQRQMELDASEASTLSLPGWTALKTSIDNDFKIVSLKDVSNKESGSTIAIMGTSNNINAILEVVHNFIKENAIKEEFLMAQKGTAAVVNQYLKAELQTICRDFQSCRVIIKEDLNASRAGFTVSGTVHGLQSALNKVAELLKKVFEKEKVLDRPGISGYLHSTRGQKQIDVIQSRHSVFIVDWEEANRSNAVSAESKKSVAAAGANSGHQAQILDEIRLKSTFAIKVVLGNITEYKVDAIVNAANGQLEHYGGVARAIVDKGGPDIQSECRNHIKSRGLLLAGHHFVSKPGSLPCKCIFHAVGPIWEGGHKNEENVLFETVYNVLMEAEKRKLQSIAMPAISTGVYGFPMRKAAKITLEAVAEFVEKENPRSLREVHIIDNNRNATREFKDMLATHGTPSKRRSGTGRPIVVDDDDDDDDEHDASPYRSFRGGSSVDADLPSYLYKTSPNARLSKPPTSSSSSSSLVSSNVLTTLQGLKITLVKGSIVEQTVDVIVNTTAQNLALNNGAVSSLILQTAGASIQAECKRKAPNGLNLGEVVITPGYNLPCKFVYHGYCLNWDGANKGPCEQAIRDLLKSIFLEAHTKLVTSIAIPAIGTGNLKVPPDLVAKIMYEEAELFSSNHVGTTLQDVRFVVYSKDQPTISAFEKELRFPTRGLKLKKKNAHRMLAKKESGDISSPTGSGPGDFGGWSISIGNVKLEVTEGDVTRATTEAIVNSVNASLDLTMGAVSSAILKAGGREIQEECKKIGKMTDGMVITGAGRLPSKLIFHLKAHNSDRNWKRGIENCLEEAERRRIQTITFPLLGTGNIGAPVRSMASVMLDSVVNFSTKSSPQHLQLIRIAIFQPHMVEEFAQTIDKKAQELQSDGYFDQLKVYVKSIFGYKSAASTSFNIEQLPQPKVQKFGSTVRLVIYGLAMNSIESAICELDDLCNDVIQDKVIEKETIAKLSPEQIERIRNLETEFSTKISVEQGHRLNRIRVQGEGHTIISVVDRIYTIFEEVERKERDEYQAEVVAKQAQWMYQCDDSYDPYPKPINLIIEDAYQKRLPSAKWEEEDGSYHLDFNRMEETKDNDASSKVKVKRTTSESLIPKSWDVMNSDEQCRKVLLPPTSQEYQDVVKNVQATAGGTVQQIVSIERIQNPSLYQQYMVRKDAMTMQQSANASANVSCERVLWHGTSVDTLESINHHGFNRSYCGKNAVVYGRGVYFALNFNYSGSNTYAVPDPNGNKHVYQSRVLTGEFDVGNQQYFVPPPKSGSAVARYDSVVDNPAAPTIFVIFSDTQAYPEYLIVFK